MAKTRGKDRLQENTGVWRMTTVVGEKKKTVQEIFEPQKGPVLTRFYFYYCQDRKASLKVGRRRLDLK